MAADAYLVRIYVPRDQISDLKIDIVGDHPDLHLIVDDQLYNNSAGDRERNRFHRELRGKPEPHSFFVRVANVAEDATASVGRGYTLRVTLPSAPLAGNMFVRFTGSFNGSPDEIPYSEKVSIDWLAVLDIETGPPQPDTGFDLGVDRERLVYPNAGSEWRLSGGYLHQRCAPGHPDVCNYWTEQKFSGGGSLTAGSGDLRIVSEGDLVHLETRLPVTVSTTVHDQSRVVERATSETRHWTLNCQSSGRWGRLPGHDPYPPPTGWNTAGGMGQTRPERRYCSIALSNGSHPSVAREAMKGRYQPVRARPRKGDAPMIPAGGCASREFCHGNQMMATPSAFWFW